MLNLKDSQDLLFKKSSEIKREFSLGVRRSGYDSYGMTFLLRSSQTFVMLTSNTGYDTLATGDKFTLSVGVKRTTGGTTDIKALVKATNCKYNESSYCMI